MEVGKKEYGAEIEVEMKKDRMELEEVEKKEYEAAKKK